MGEADQSLRQVLRVEMQRRGHNTTSFRWVYTNKGDKWNPNIRARLCGRELKAKTREQLELFSAMPPWEALKALFSLLVTDESVEDGPANRAHVLQVGLPHRHTRAHEGTAELASLNGRNRPRH